MGQLASTTVEVPQPGTTWCGLVLTDEGTIKWVWNYVAIG